MFGGKFHFLCLLYPFILSSCLIAAQQNDKPNLIILYTDEHNFRTIGAYRDTLRRDQAFIWGDGVEVKTPHLDSLANEGALLTNFYVVNPLCTPSRASFMTGLYPMWVEIFCLWKLEVECWPDFYWFSATGASGNNDKLDANMKTFAEILRKEKGYMTGKVNQN